MEGMARYASKCSQLFHMRVPMTSDSRTPSSSRSACASRAARPPTSAKLRRRGSSPPAQVVTVAAPWTVEPWLRIRDTNSGTSCMVLCIGGASR